MLELYEKFPPQQWEEIIEGNPQKYKGIVDYNYAHAKDPLIGFRQDSEFRYQPPEGDTIKIPSFQMGDLRTLELALAQVGLKPQVGGMIIRSTIRGFTKYLINEEGKLIKYTPKAFFRLRDLQITIKWIKPFNGGTPE